MADEPEGKQQQWETVFAKYTANYQITNTIIITILSMLEREPVLSNQGGDDAKSTYQQLYSELNKSLHSNFHFSETDLQLNRQLIEKATRLNKGVKLKADMARQDYEILNKKEEASKPDDVYYQKILISLSDHAGFAITDSIMTFEYCERVLRLNTYIDLNNKKYGKR